MHATALASKDELAIRDVLEHTGGGLELVEIVVHEGAVALALAQHTMRRLSGEKTTEVTPRVCPSRSSKSMAPVSASQTRTVVSYDPNTMCCPSGEKATEETAPVCPSRGLKSAAPVSASQTQTVLSHDPDAMRCPSGEKAREMMSEACPLDA